ncbi:MAG: TonB-dependent receptor plug domain-containing protein, partial [Pseudomonadota bacterium]
MTGTHRGNVVLALTFLIASASLAPKLVLADDDDDVGVEEVVVTGSRITRGNVDSPQPISTISSEDINRTGTLDIAEVLNDTPALLSSVTNSNSIDDAADNTAESNNVGGSALNLRGLGFERTLTLVNGRRHVAGIEGTSAVDVSTIPSALIERVEVLTGGASAVYGADAVTGVVNFILKEDFEGLEIDLSPGLSGESDGESIRGSVLWGQNFANERGNVTIAVQYNQQEGIRQGDRDFLANDRLADDDRNPARQFQIGDIETGSTPAFAQFYSIDAGRYPRGFNIPTSAEDFVADFTDEFGTAPTLTSAELALIDRAATAPPQAFLPGRVFSLTSPYGVVAPSDFGGDVALGDSPDLDGDGTADCLQSFQGFRTDFVLGGCWFIDAGGNLTPYQDGLISDSASVNQFGASQSFIAPNRPFVIPESEQLSIAFNGRFEFSPQLEAFWETKYDEQEITFGGGGHDFRDLVYQSFENPFLPEELVTAYAGVSAPFGPAGAGPGLHITIDADDWGSNESVTERITTRFVFGLRGAF